MVCSLIYVGHILQSSFTNFLNMVCNLIYVGHILQNLFLQTFWIWPVVWFSTGCACLDSSFYANDKQAMIDNLTVDTYLTDVWRTTPLPYVRITLSYLRIITRLGNIALIRIKLPKSTESNSVQQCQTVSNSVKRSPTFSFTFIQVTGVLARYWLDVAII